MTLENDLKALANHEHFARFIQVLHRLREETISEMHNADYEKLQQLSGRIITYDQILQLADWDNLRQRHSQSLN
tara:strand:- start:1474 stop:1695 length:222 start_codon:yes stop_codon:yes gene_type:complete